MHSIPHRPAFVEAHPSLQPLHHRAKSALFAAIERAGLSCDRDLQLEGFNAAFHRKGARRLISHEQLKVEELEVLTSAVEAGLFAADWSWNHPFMIFLQTATVEATVELPSLETSALETSALGTSGLEFPAFHARMQMKVRMAKAHFEPLSGERARQWSQPQGETAASAW